MPDSIRVYRVRHCAMGAVALASALCVAELAISQQKSEVSQDNKSSTVIRRVTRLVSVSLVVTDAQGNPVKDLAKNEVTLLDEGKPQVISFFSAVDDAQLLPTRPTPAPDTYTNLLAGKAEPPSVTILLFDVLNSKWTSQGYGLYRVHKFLRQIEPQDHLGLYLLSDDLKVLHDFRDDASALVATIQRYDEERSQSASKPAALKPGAANENLVRFLSGKENRSRYVIVGPCLRGSSCQDKRAIASQITTASLQAIARELSLVPGRKTLIWVTDNIGTMDFFVDDDLDEYLKSWRNEAGLKIPSGKSYTNGNEIEGLVRLMNEAGISVYPTSAEGLETEDLGFRNTVGGSGSQGAVEDLLSRLPDPSAHMAMEELARRTGGRAFFNRNDLETGIRRALEDSRFTYQLAYYPDHNQWKGKWRKIEAKVDRLGLKVLARSGYFALPDVRPLAPKSRHEFLSELAASPLDSPQLPMSVRLAAASDEKGRQLHAQVRLNPASMLALDDDGKWKGSFEVVFMQMGKNNKLLDLTAASVDAKLSAKEYANASQNGYQLPADLTFMPGVVELCVILRDKRSDAAGSVHISLERYAASPGPQ